MTPEEILERGRRVIRLEREALASVEDRLGDAFARAVTLIAASRGRVIVAGVGKSGLIGRKIAATLTSTGTPAAFLHPADSAHGDLGIVGGDDVAILISKSGESDELLALLEHLQGLGIRARHYRGSATWRWMLGCARKRARTTWPRRRAPPSHSPLETRWP
jgi:arabinose-5-phosphate isomerase